MNYAAAQVNATQSAPAPRACSRHLQHRLALRLPAPSSARHPTSDPTPRSNFAIQLQTEARGQLRSPTSRSNFRSSVANELSSRSNFGIQLRHQISRSNFAIQLQTQPRGPTPQSNFAIQLQVQLREPTPQSNEYTHMHTWEAFPVCN